MINILTYIIYAVDKRKAMKHQNRISEQTLMMLMFMGGFIGAVLSMYHFHHKTRKPRFAIFAIFCLFLHICLLLIIRQY